MRLEVDEDEDDPRKVSSGITNNNEVGNVYDSEKWKSIANDDEKFNKAFYADDDIEKKKQFK